MRALRLTLILFAAILVSVVVFAVRGTAQPHAAELIVEPADMSASTSGQADAYDRYAQPVPVTAEPAEADLPPSETPEPAAPSPSPSQQAGTPAWITGIYVNLREGPGTAYDIIGTYDYATPLLILDTVGNWAHIIIEGQEGYMTMNLIDTQHPDDFEPAPQRADAYTGSSSASSHTGGTVQDPYAGSDYDMHPHNWTVTTVNHPAETHTIYHEAEYETVWHEADEEHPEPWEESVLVKIAWREHVVDKAAWSEEVTVCSICGIRK